MASRSNPFDLPKSYLKQIGPEIEQFRYDCDAYTDDYGVHSFVRSPDQGAIDFGMMLNGGRDLGPCKVIGFRMRQPIPEHLERAAFRIITELRSILDKSMGSCARFLDVDPYPKHRNFPFAETRAELEGQFKSAANEKGPFRGIPAELYPHLIKLHPCRHDVWTRRYTNLLWALGGLSNPAKHDDVLMVDFVSDGLTVLGSAHILHTYPRWNDERTECEVCLIDSSHPFKVALRPAITLFPVFGLPPLTRAGEVLREIYNVVQDIVAGLEVEVARLVAQRQI